LGGRGSTSRRCLRSSGGSTNEDGGGSADDGDGFKGLGATVDNGELSRQCEDTGIGNVIQGVKLDLEVVSKNMLAHTQRIQNVPNREDSFESICSERSFDLQSGHGDLKSEEAGGFTVIIDGEHLRWKDFLIDDVQSKTSWIRPSIRSE